MKSQLKTQAIQDKLQELGLGFVRVDSATQTPTQLGEGETLLVSGGAAFVSRGYSTPSPTPRPPVRFTSKR